VSNSKQLARFSTSSFFKHFLQLDFQGTTSLLSLLVPLTEAHCKT
jgi:hypothetical protein